MPKILVVDDGETILNLISKFLKNAGYDVVTAKDGEEGFKRFNEFDFDLVITDLVMPKCDGNEMAMKIHDKAKKIPVIGISSIPWDFNRHYFNAVLEKPFEFQELNECIKSLIQGDKSF